MLFERKEQENQINYQALKEIEYKNKFGFLDQLKSCVKTDEEYAKYKGYID